MPIPIPDLPGPIPSVPRPAPSAFTIAALQAPTASYSATSYSHLGQPWHPQHTSWVKSKTTASTKANMKGKGKGKERAVEEEREEQEDDDEDRQATFKRRRKMEPAFGCDDRAC